MGAYFSLLAYKSEQLKQSLFLSPMIDMCSFIQNTMKLFDIYEEMLASKKEIILPNKMVLYWDYYEYVKNNPIDIWNTNTCILYGKHDNIESYSTLLHFVDKFHCNLTTSPTSEHYFHTENDVAFYKMWLEEHIIR